MMQLIRWGFTADLTAALAFSGTGSSGSSGQGTSSSGSSDKKY